MDRKEHDRPEPDDEKVRNLGGGKGSSISDVPPYAITVYWQGCEHFCSDLRSGRAQAEGMTTPAEYRSFAKECVNWAKAASDASERQTLLRAARMWTEVALRLDSHVVTATDKAALFKELRAKLD